MTLYPAHETATSLCDWITHHKTVVITTVLLIAIVHFHESIWQYYRSYRIFNLGPVDVFIAVYCQCVETVRAWWQLARESWRHAPASPSSSNITSPSSSFSMPLLEQVENDSSFQSTIQPRHHHHDIEPAFLDERMYPEGWMVFHPVLGVVTKEQADAYGEGGVMSSDESSVPNVQDVPVQTLDTPPVPLATQIPENGAATRLD